jgi:hypothetical protein
MQIDLHDLRHPASDRVAAGEAAPVSRAISHGDNPLGRRRRVVRSFERFAHVLGDGFTVTIGKGPLAPAVEGAVSLAGGT